ncbi:MAG: trehalose-6-phosphate synthase [Candidatus Latescibacteria bacterium 4484_7]|nr:MAG: trehalose-6-phosphate synthase [Candidatus Latescibacteria bacterium 4484_7]
MNDMINRLVIISNRLPIILEKENGKWKTIPGSGGLVTALAPVLKNRGGMWIGWPGTSELTDVSKPIEKASSSAGFTMKPVLLNEEEIEGYYIGLSNEVIWPLFHDLQSYCNFDPQYWDTYKEINRRFAEVTIENTSTEDFIWVHDYHLINVAQELKKLGTRSKIGFFLHIPFPPLDIFFKLPWRREILLAMLEYDVIGFQTLRDRRNFIQCVRALTEGIIIQGKGQVIIARIGNRTIRICSFPISIDYKNFVSLARSKKVADEAWFIHEKLPGYQIILGIDRLDYTKGIPYRLKAFRNALQRYPELLNKVILIQVVVPSRRNIPVYNELKEEIERLVGEINGEFTRSGWVPIHYIYRSLRKNELLAYYRTAEIALITPLKDGMNLVAKEYCVSNIEEKGVLILSEFAGTAAQLQKGALLVNPYDIQKVADAIYRAFKMDEAERKIRMSKMRKAIKRSDIFWWVNSYLQAAISHDLESFPLLEEYLPPYDI